MDIPKYITKIIDERESCESKEVWNKLKETDDAHILIPSIDALDYKYKHINSFIRMKTLDSLKYTSNYYHYVNDIYQKNEFILPTDFFECHIHPNEFDAVYVTEKAKNTANMLCKTIDERIKELEQKQNN